MVQEPTSVEASDISKYVNMSADAPSCATESKLVVHVLVMREALNCIDDVYLAASGGWRKCLAIFVKLVFVT